MAVGDRITGARTTEFMRRINALESHPRATDDPYDVKGEPSGHFDINPPMDIDSNGDIVVGGLNLGIKAHIYDRETLNVIDIYDTYPGSETKFPGNIHVLGTDIYSFFGSVSSESKYKYTRSTDTWAELTSADADFLPGPGGNWMQQFDGEWYQIVSVDEIEVFNTSGVSQSVITLDEPPEDHDVSWYVVHFDFDDDDNLVVITSNVHGIGEVEKFWVNRYDTSGNVLTGTMTGGADAVEIDSHNAGRVRVVANRDDGLFAIANIGADDDSPNLRSYDKDGNERADSIGATTGDIVGIRYYNDEIYVIDRTSSGAGSKSTLSIFDKDGVLQISTIMFGDFTQPTQTTFYRYPRYDSETGKVSLGTPDGGTSVPALTGLDGFRPHSFELRDMRDTLELEAVQWGREVDSGETTSTTANKLVDSTQNFTSTILVGDIVTNTTDGTKASVTAIDSDTTLSIDDNIMVSGDDYRIVSKYTTSAGSSNIFRNAIDSGQDDWTTVTVDAGDRIRDDHYSDIDSVLTELEAAELMA